MDIKELEELKCVLCKGPHKHYDDAIREIKGWIRAFVIIAFTDALLIIAFFIKIYFFSGVK